MYSPSCTSAIPVRSTRPPDAKPGTSKVSPPASSAPAKSSSIALRRFDGDGQRHTGEARLRYAVDDHVARVRRRDHAPGELQRVEGPVGALLLGHRDLELGAVGGELGQVGDG